ncbi:hypothetical protein ACIA5D_36475 [Actinoplanes sp. NPDC051513]|uniref:hypothetical protein n=1 Tax=Actinoplanes sp. NPDC051513 TaxID=3363908 RepID=UPI0037AB30C6
MTWENTKRASRKAERRRLWHEARIAAAATPKQKAWAACGWLISEAWRAGRLDDALDWVLVKVHELREEERNDDDRDDGYAA